MVLAAHFIDLEIHYDFIALAWADDQHIGTDRIHQIAVVCGNDEHGHLGADIAGQPGQSDDLMVSS